MAPGSAGELFPTESPSAETSGMAPLAARMRPRALEEFVGQEHAVGPGSALRALVDADRLSSIILWGPPGSGKTSLAGIIARSASAEYLELSAVSSGVADVRRAIQAGRENLDRGLRTILFIDEIHRFNKSQQDALLKAVESGWVVLIGATTENPFFEVNSPLLSRSLLFRLEPLGPKAIRSILERALRDSEVGLGDSGVEADADAIDHIVDRSGGDARFALNALEACAAAALATPDRRLTLDLAEEALQRRRVRYDKGGDVHYDVVSAFIKSLRGSDADAALWWLNQMLESGEDPRFIARRMVILASEDIGNADPIALVVAVAAFQALEFVGLPEAALNLAHAATYLAAAPKSNAATKALARARAAFERNGAMEVPPHLRDAHSPGARGLGHGRGYRYPHDYPGGWVQQGYLPEGLAPPEPFYQPTEIGHERRIRERQEERRP